MNNEKVLEEIVLLLFQHLSCTACGQCPIYLQCVLLYGFMGCIVVMLPETSSRDSNLGLLVENNASASHYLTTLQFRQNII